jgi:hypothetical protein
LKLRLLMVGAALLAAPACGGGDRPAKDSGLLGGLVRAAQRMDSLDRANPYRSLEDPCVLVTRGEAERYLGPLAHDPFRADDGGVPNPSGSSCVYRAADGRNIRLDVSYKNGSAGMAAVSIGSGLAGPVLNNPADAADTLRGSWDKATWMIGHLYVLKGDVLVEVDATGSRAGRHGAADLANRALARLGQPLAYDGAAAARDAPPPRATGDACALITAAEAEAILGPLAGAPAPGGEGTRTHCSYSLRGAGAGSPAEVRLDVTWHGGFAALADGRATMGAYRAHMETPIEGAAAPESVQREMAKDPTMQRMLGGLRQMAGQQGIQTTTAGFPATDTLVAGPWDEAALLSGSFAAVKQDVMMSVAGVANYGRIKALIAKAMSRL